VGQVGHLPELYEDTRSEKYKILWDCQIKDECAWTVAGTGEMRNFQEFRKEILNGWYSLGDLEGSDDTA
jgi:hypothetical protein